jgi:hypothetical protein
VVKNLYSHFFFIFAQTMDLASTIRPFVRALVSATGVGITAATDYLLPECKATDSVFNLVEALKPLLYSLHPEYGPDLTNLELVILWAHHFQPYKNYFGKIKFLLDRCEYIVQPERDRLSELVTSLDSRMVRWFVETFPAFFGQKAILLFCWTKQELIPVALKDDASGIVKRLVHILTSGNPITWYLTMLGANLRIDPDSFALTLAVVKLCKTLFIEMRVPRLPPELAFVSMVLRKCSKSTLKLLYTELAEYSGSSSASLEEMFRNVLKAAPKSGGLPDDVVVRLCKVFWPNPPAPAGSSNGTRGNDPRQVVDLTDSPGPTVPAQNTVPNTAGSPNRGRPTKRPRVSDEQPARGDVTLVDLTGSHGPTVPVQSPAPSPAVPGSQPSSVKQCEEEEKDAANSLCALFGNTTNFTM